MIVKRTEKEIEELLQKTIQRNKKNFAYVTNKIAAHKQIIVKTLFAYDCIFAKKCSPKAVFSEIDLIAKESLDPETAINLELVSQEFYESVHRNIFYYYSQMSDMIDIENKSFDIESEKRFLVNLLNAFTFIDQHQTIDAMIVYRDEDDDFCYRHKDLINAFYYLRDEYRKVDKERNFSYIDFRIENETYDNENDTMKTLDILDF